MWLTDLLVGAITAGVNLPTHICINVVLACAFASLLLLLVASLILPGSAWLAPHVVVLLVLATGLWVSINWYISNIGIVSPEEQQQQLLGSGPQPRQTGSADKEEESKKAQ
ncbi:hypothetical protein V8C86DRAFT_2571488 [Haematococcus lacustris]